MNVLYAEKLLPSMKEAMIELLFVHGDKLVEPQFNEDAVRILNERYLIKDNRGQVIETLPEFLARVAIGVQYDALCDAEDDIDMSEIYENAIKYYNMMARLEFLPGSPTLMNAGTPMGQLSACFVVPVGDSMPEIMDAVKSVALIHQSGGGTGMDFSSLRPKNARVGSTGGVASGPVSFMKIFDATTEQIKQGGCIDITSRVSTEEGLVLAGTLINGRLNSNAPVAHSVLSKDGLDHAYLSTDNGIDQVYDINTGLGYGISLTKDHLVRVVNDDATIGWKKASEIIDGDWLVMRRGIHRGKTRVMKSAEITHGNQTDVSLPIDFNQSIAEVAGLFTADGCLSGNNGNDHQRLIFAVSDDDTQVDDVLKRFSLAVGIPMSVTKKPDDQSHCNVLNSSVLGRFWNDNGLNKDGALNARVPEIVFQSPELVVKAYLRGLFSGDGYVMSTGYPALSSTSSDLIDDVQQLLLSVGMISSVTVNDKRDLAYGDNPLYVLRLHDRTSIEMFASEIGFIQEYKNQKLAEALLSKDLGRESLAVPFFDKMLARHYSAPGRGVKGTESPTVVKELGRYLRGDRQPKRNKVMALCNVVEGLENEEMLVDDLFFAKVVSTSTRNAVQTMDIETTSSEFVANGVCIHNKRRGANMGMLRIDHPDILEFIECKDDDKSLQNFNISVAVTDEFMAALSGAAPKVETLGSAGLEHAMTPGAYAIRDPKTGSPIKYESASDVWNKLVTHAWNTGDPGIVFIDKMNASLPFDLEQYPEHRIVATNPCGEQPLEAYEACNLGSINLAKFVDHNGFDLDRLRVVIQDAVRMLDDVVSSSRFPLPQITEKVLSNRKIGLGVMGFADSMLAMKIRYGSDEACGMAYNIMSYVQTQAHLASEELAHERDYFPNYGHMNVDEPDRRNACITTIAPTGTISMLANGTSSGIEPVFAFTYTKKVMDGQLFQYVHPEIEKQILAEGDEKPRWWDEFIASGQLPENVRQYWPHFVGAMDVTPEEHVRMQAAFQIWTDNAVSKTVNLPNSATVEDVDNVYRLAYDTGCKGVTIYRDGSKSDQVLFTGNKSENNAGEFPEDGRVLVTTEEFEYLLKKLEEEDPLQRIHLLTDADMEELTKHQCSGNCKTTREPAPRPEVMLGLTVKAETPCGHLYVTISEDEDGKPFEVFCKLGKSGACAGAVQETMGRMISSELRSGGDVSRIIKQLRGASCGQAVGFGPKKVTSCIDAIGLVLQRYENGEFHNHFASEFSTPVDEPVDKPVDLPDGPGAMLVTESYKPKSNYGACPECGSPMEHEGGCAACRSCGYSKCA